MSAETWLKWCLTLLHPRLLAWHALAALLIGTALFSLARAAIFFVFSFLRTEKLKHRIHSQSRTIPQKLVAVNQAVKLPRSAIQYIRSPQPQLFCLGFWRPVIVVSDSLVELLSDEELTATLKHEAYHLRHHHPLRLLLAETLRELFWFMSVADDLVQYWRYKAEAHADRFAVGNENGGVLRSALQKLLKHPSPAWRGLAFAGSPAQARIHTLLSGTVLPFQPSWPRLQQSLLIAGVFLSLTLTLCFTGGTGSNSGSIPTSSNLCTQPLFSPDIR